jgi:hypothetical protein
MDLNAGLFLHAGQPIGGGANVKEPSAAKTTTNERLIFSFYNLSFGCSKLSQC